MESNFRRDGKGKRFYGDGRVEKTGYMDWKITFIFGNIFA